MGKVTPITEQFQHIVRDLQESLEKVRKRDYEAVKVDAQAIYRAGNRKAAQAAFRAFQARWQNACPAMVKRLERDLPELLSFYSFPKHLWRTLRM